MPPTGSTRLSPGQAFVYAAEWRLFDAGTAVLRMDSAGPLMKVTGTADASGVVALLYRVHDRFEALFDPRTFCSVSISKRTEEGFRRIETNIRYDYGRGKSVLDERNLKSGKSKRQENEIPGCVTDVVSSLYYVGSLPLQEGATFTFPLNDGGRTGHVRITVEGREQLKVPAGTFNTFRVRAEATEGAAKDRGKAWLWYAEDLRMPVQMRARLFWGSLSFRLQRIDR